MENEGYVVITGYCMKCKKRRDMVNAEVGEVKTKRGIKTIAKGKCEICGTKMAKIMKKG